MAPGPKAELTFSFAPFNNPPLPKMATPIKEVTVPLESDGSIHVEFTILNLTNVDAIETEGDVQICDECRYAKEPSGLSKLPGMGKTLRFLSINNLHALEAYQTISVDIAPPPGISQMPIGFSYRCRTCGIHPGITPEAMGTIRIERP
jgi:hypothetical protein